LNLRKSTQKILHKSTAELRKEFREQTLDRCVTRLDYLLLFLSLEGIAKYKERGSVAQGTLHKQEILL
jgi:hypothetical protein